jgi:hypothetical protein
VLGTPVWSIFEGPMGGVDEMLERSGRLHLLGDPAEIEVSKKDADRYESRVRRDPRELLEMALPWLAALNA